MIVYLVRHTAVANPYNLCYGRSEMKLADDFETVSAAISDKLPADIGQCVSSPLTRCSRLAEVLCRDRGVDVRVDDALVELGFGEWELQPWDKIDRHTFDTWAEDFVNQPVPGGESFQQLQRRVLDFWQKLQGDCSDGNMLIVTHGGVIRALLAHVQKRPLSEAFETPIEPGCVVRIDTQGITFL